MSLLCLSLRRRLTLLLLLMAAAPLRTAPIEAETSASAAATWDQWPAGMLRNSYRRLGENGSPLPKFAAVEMAPEFGDAFAKAFNFPALPMSGLGRRWRLWHQRYDKYLKELQVHRTWVGDLQSPAAEEGSERAQLWQLPARTRTSTRPQRQRQHKRDPSEYQGPRFRPSISAGVMTNLGDFFNQLKANVQFAEHSQQLGEAESQLLDGAHPHPLDPANAGDTEDDADYDSGQPPDRKTASKLLQSVRSYRPSQKIRSLVSRNPNGYRGSQFIDPSYMWLGLGK